MRINEHFKWNINSVLKILPKLSNWIEFLIEITTKRVQRVRVCLCFSLFNLTEDLFAQPTDKIAGLWRDERWDEDLRRFLIGDEERK